MKLWNYIRQKMLEHPDQVVCEGDAFMTYEELFIFADQYSKKLTSSYYGIFCNSEMAAAMALLSCIAAEKPAIPFPTRYGEAYYTKIREKADPPCLLTDHYGTLKEYPLSPEPFPSPLRSSPSVILYTSGSTGAPKGVMLSEENLLSNIQGISSYFPIGKDDTILISRPLYHSSVLTGEFLTALCKGAKIVFSSEAFQPRNLINLMKKHKVTVFGSTPTLMTVLSGFVRNGEAQTIRLLSISGECMNEGMAKRIRRAFPNADVYCGYGLSEASPRVAYLPAKYFDTAPTSAGIPLPNVKIRIEGRDGVIREANQEGELLVQSPGMMLGYFEDRERTDAVIKNGWLYTGDIACYGDDGMLYIKGRKDDMINRAGMNIYPAEIENALSKDHRVYDALVYGYEKGGTREIGLKICGDFLENEEVMEFCRARLPDFQLPSKIELVFETEVYALGKKRRKNF